MNIPHLALAAVIFLCGSLHLPAQPDLRDAPETDAALLLRELDAIETRQKQTLGSEKARVFSTLRAAAAGGTQAVNLYEKAVEETRFAGRKDKVQAFTDWKKQNGDAFRGREMQEAALLHVRYLILSLERADADDAGDFAKPSLEYAVTLAGALESRRKAQGVPKDALELLDKPLAQGVIAQWFGLAPWLPKGDSWEPVPGNLAGILDKNVRPVLRENRDPRLLETWDYQIALEAARVEDGRLEHAAARFERIDRPNILFSKANDTAALGLKNRAVQEIIVLAKAHPSHPDFSKWIERARELLAPPAGGDTPAAQP